MAGPRNKSLHRQDFTARKNGPETPGSADRRWEGVGDAAPWAEIPAQSSESWRALRPRLVGQQSSLHEIEQLPGKPPLQNLGNMGTAEGGMSLGGYRDGCADAMRGQGMVRR